MAESAELNPTQQLTAELSQEIDPVLSPDGKWLVYVSNRSGNYDLWIKGTDGGLAMQLTTHPASDYDPCWAPSGEKLCFVSTRDDPAGDIYLLKFSVVVGQPKVTYLRPILEKPGQQSHPTISKNGDFIAFQVGDAESGNISLLRKGHDVVVTLTGKGYIKPSFSPINDKILGIQISDSTSETSLVVINPGELKNPESTISSISTGSFPITSACWSPDGKSIIASLVAVDRNLDGWLTSSDQTVLYRFDPTDSTYSYRRMTASLASELTPSWASDGNIYYATRNNGETDLQRVDEEGIIPHLSSADSSFSFAMTLYTGYEKGHLNSAEESLQTVQMAFERVRYDFPESHNLCAKSLLYQSRALRDAGLVRPAMNILRRIPVQYSDQSDVLAQAQYDFQLLIHHAEFSGDYSFHCDNRTSLISNLNQFISIHQKNRLLSATALLTIGAAYESLNDSTALKIYQQISDDYSDIESINAQAAFRTARIYEIFGQTGGSNVAYVDVIRKYPDYTEVVSDAVDAILKPLRSDEDRIGSLQTLIGRYRDLPEIGAAAQLEIADQLATRGDTALAITEYNRVDDYIEETSSDYVRSRHALALIREATLDQKLAEFTKAEKLYEKVISTYVHLANGQYAEQAREKNLQSLIARGDYTASQGDWALANALYTKAVELDPENAEIHRKRISAANHQGVLSETINEYKNLLSENPDDAVLQYALGVCYSLEGNAKLYELYRSIDYLNKAISSKPTLVHGYLTLAGDYELLEEHKRRLEEKAQQMNPALFVWQQLRTGFGIFKRSSNPENIHGYEKAIEVLELGVAINNEKAEPVLEGELYLRLGSSYYELGEFGYKRALEAFRSVDSLPVNYRNQMDKAGIYEKAGHCASIVGESEAAINYYEFSLKRYKDSGDLKSELRILLRLAEHYQVTDKPEIANRYYADAMRLIHKEGLEADKSRILENVAYNSLKIGDNEEALRVSVAAQKELKVEADNRRTGYYNPLTVEIGGLTVPLWNFGYLGVGSPMSALGFSTAEKKLLNYAQIQMSQEKLGNLKSALAAASQRLRDMIEREDFEGQAIIWNEVGTLRWQMGDFELAYRCFMRSYSLSKKHHLTKGELTALIDMATMQAAERPIQLTNDLRLKEALWLSEYDIGFSSEIWNIVADEISGFQDGISFKKMRGRINRRLFRDISAIDPRNRRLDLDGIYRFLLLEEQPLTDTLQLRNMISNRLSEFTTKLEQFVPERVKLYNLYGKLFFKSIQNPRPTTLAARVTRLQEEAEVLWAFSSAQRLAENSGETFLAFESGINQSDLYFAFGDASKADSILTELTGNAIYRLQSALMWRIYWRKAKALFIEGHRTNVLNWIEKAIIEWNKIPAESILKQSSDLKNSESTSMLTLALQISLNRNNPEGALKYLQLLDDLNFMQLIDNKQIDLKTQRRKLVWNGKGGLVPYYRERIVTLQQEQLEKPDSAKVKEVKKKLVDVLKDFNELISKTATEDPEFLSLFYLNSLPVDTLQNHLQRGELALDYVNNRWIGSTNTKLFIVPAMEDNIAFIDTLQNKCPDLARVFWVHSGESVGEEIRAECRQRGLELSLLPNWQSLVFLDSKVALGKGIAASFTSAIQTERLSFKSFEHEEDLVQAIENANVAVFSLPSREEENPLDISIYRNKGINFQVRDLMAIETKGDLLVFTGNVSNLDPIIKASIFAGWSNVLVVPRGIPSDLLAQFLDAVIEKMVTLSVGEAISEASSRFNNDNNPSLAGMLLYGKGGLNQTQRIDYAERNFIETVQKGNYNLENGQADWALIYYNRAIDMAAELQDTTALINLNQLKINAGQEIANWSEVVRSQIALLRLSGPSAVNRSEGLRNLSVYYYNEGDLGEAILRREHALDLSEKMADSSNSAEDNFVLAHWYYENEQPDLAGERIDSAKVYYSALNRPEKVLQCAVFKAQLLITAGDYYPAIRELRTVESIVADSASSGVDVTGYYLITGLVQEGLSNYRDALESFGKAIHFQSDQGMTVDAAAYFHSANCYWMLSDYQKALDNIQKARVALPNTGGRLPYLIDNSEALIRFSMGLKAEAMKPANTALAGAISSGDLKSQSNIGRNIGLFEAAEGHYDRALERLNQALQDAEDAGDKRSSAQCHLDIGLALSAAESADSAAVHYQLGLSDGLAVQDAITVTQGHLAQAGYYLDKKDLSSVKIHLDQAKELARRAGLRNLEWQIATVSGEYYLLTSDRVSAINSLNQAIDILEETPELSSYEKLRPTLALQRKKPYNMLIDLMISEGNLPGALDIAERYIGLDYTGRIAKNAEIITAGIPKTKGNEVIRLLGEQERLRGIRDHILQRNAFSEAPASNFFSRLVGRIDSTESIYHTLLDSLDLIHPGYADLLTVQFQPIDQIQQLLLPNEVMLEYYTSTNQTYVFVISNDGITFKTIDLKDEEITERIDGLISRLEKRLDVSKEASDLYDKLIKPVEGTIRGKESLIIIPCDELFELPFALLSSGGNHCLLDDFGISYGVSAKHFTECRRSAKRKEISPDPEVLAVKSIYENLPQEANYYRQEEVKNIAYSYSNTTILSDEAATETALKSDVGQADLVHLVCQGQFANDTGGLFGIQLAPDKQNNGDVTLEELYQLNLGKCQLFSITSSSIDTDSSSSGKGIIDFLRAITYSGSPRILFSLWSKNELSAALLTKHFYRELNDDITPAEALRRAQLHIKNRINPHPAYWAGFLLTGEPEGVLSPGALP